MTKEEIQASIKSIMFSGSVCGIEIYACLRDESGYQLWRGWSILICTFNFFDFCAITFNQSHPGEDSRKVRISRL